MQVLNLDAELNISRLDADIRTLRLGEGGTTNYNDLTNKPSINSVTLTGNKTTSDLNIKTSELVNDAGFITNANIPTKTSDLINDDGFQTAAQVSSAVAAAIPTEVSAFTNDAGYITAAQVGNIPTKTSDLDNDSGFITSAQAPVQSVNGYTGAVNLVASDIEVSAGVTVADDLSDLASSIPTKTSDLTNDSGFITSLNVPSKTSDLVNDSGFVTNQINDSTTADSTTWSSDKIVSYIASFPQTETITDTAVASFSDGAENVPVSELIVDIDAVQDLHGYDKPWSGGGGKNKFDISTITTGRGINTNSGNTFANANWNVSDFIPMNEGKITISWNSTSGFYQVALAAYDSTTAFISGSGVPYSANDTYSHTFDIPSGANYIRFSYSVAVGGTAVERNNIRLNIGSSDLGYEPYENICPISGHSTCTIKVNDDIDEPQTEITKVISLGQTVYGGSLNVTTGELTVTSGYIASYNGEAINEPWISSIDEYVPNTSPSTGAEVVYTLATPTTVQLTPTEVRTLLGNNNIFADTGNINELVYFKTGCEAIARLIEAYK